MARTSHRALHLPDILRELVPYLSVLTPYSDIALVWKDWSEVVLDHKWRVVSAHQLFQLLAPLSWDRSRRFLCFSQPISKDSWSSFQKYHYRIRNFHCSRSSLHPCVYAIAGFNRPYSGTFLPNLTRLDCTCDPIDIQLLASPSITTLHLKDEIEGLITTQQEYELTLRCLPSCIPNLETLFLFARSDKQSIQKPLAEALATLRSLTRIHIPTMLLMPEVMAVISKLPLLKSLEGHYVSPAKLSGSLSCALGSDSFPLLESFELNGWLKPATSLLKSWLSPVSLTSLRLMEYKAIQPENYLTITEWVASHVPLLTGLVISYDEDEIEEHIDSVDPLPFSIFESLFSCERLATLAIAYPVPFEMTEVQLVSLVTALPLLSSLEIGCSRQAPESEPSLSLSVLSSIAPLCNSLKYLNIYLSCDTTSHLDHVPDPGVRFKCLGALDVSKSPIQSPISVALFMSRILPETCSLDHTESLGIEDEERDADWTQAVMVLQALRIKYREAKKSG